MTPEPNRPDEREAALGTLESVALQLTAMATKHDVTLRLQRAERFAKNIRAAVSALRRDAPREGASVDDAWADPREVVGRMRKALLQSRLDGAVAINNATVAAWIDQLTAALADRAPREGGEAVNSAMYSALRSIRYNANFGSQDRPPYERLRLIGKDAEAAIAAADAHMPAALRAPEQPS